MFKEIIGRFKTNNVNSTHFDVEYNSPRYMNILKLKELDKNTVIVVPDFEIMPEHKFTELERNNNNTAYYKNGMLYDVSPRDHSVSLDENRDIAYNARYIVLDGKKYDLYNSDSISSIELPTFKPEEASFGYVTRNLAYIMNMRAKRTFTPELAIPLVFQTVNLMIRSDISWTKKDYMRHVAQLDGIDKPQYAKYLVAQLRNIVPCVADDNYQKKLYLKRQLENARLWNTDLIEMTSLFTTCSECAKYQSRVYSISGMDKRFPKLPEQVFEYGGIHPGCTHSFNAFCYDIRKKIMIYTTGQDGEADIVYVDALKYSNRPFVDNRTDQEKERYEKLTKEREKKHRWDYDSLVKYLRRASEYDWICRYLPNMAPKSLGGYTRMKHTNSKNYLKIREAAMELNKELIEEVNE